ncbi:hypothetical protein AERO8C_120500 [Aeromonas veronii]|uniref:Uncharacterized protein n=1 Tax=Aeromonas veronii TaxID=654 RepID=A0A653KSM9_AERVE|nr:hypothetical protein AERO8C_120500 [Aeromonas veronii]
MRGTKLLPEPHHEHSLSEGCFRRTWVKSSAPGAIAFYVSLRLMEQNVMIRHKNNLLENIILS